MIYQSHINKYFDDRGFGLLSMVFVILTLSISAITIMTVINPSALTRQNQETEIKAKVLRSAIQSYQFSHGGRSGTNPPSLNDLSTTDGISCLIDNIPTNTTYQLLQGWCGPYVDQIFSQNLNDYKTDGWGSVFTYDPVTTILTSCGIDKTCGGADDLTFAP